MSTQIKIHAVFKSHGEAADALRAIRALSIPTERIFVVGQDSDEFREATADLHTTKLDKLLVWAGAFGLLAGAGWGLVGLQSIDGLTPSAIISTALAIFSGATVGMLTGFHGGVILHIDNRPASEARIKMGTVDGGVMSVSVAANSATEEEQIKLALLTSGASELWRDLDKVQFSPIKSLS